MDDELLELDFDDIEPVVNQDYEDFRAVYDHAMDDLATIEPVGQFAPAETLGPEPGLWEQAADYFIDKTAPEIWDAFTHEVSLGASELAKSLYGHADGFVLYGPSLEPIQTYDLSEPQQSYDEMLRDASQRGIEDRDMGLERG